MRMLLILILLICFNAYAQVSRQDVLDINTHINSVTNAQLHIEFLEVKGSHMKLRPHLKKIVIKTELLLGLNNKHEIAMVLAHEHAHTVLGHTLCTLSNETQADEYSRLIMLKAGYDPVIGSQYWQRMFDLVGESPHNKHHPTNKARAKFYLTGKWE